AGCAQRRGATPLWVGPGPGNAGEAASLTSLRRQPPDSGGLTDMISATLYSDPACPWAYSESPALRVIEWRYGDQLDWRLVLVGLTEEAAQYERRGYSPIRGALGQARFRTRYRMPFSPAPQARLSATSRAGRPDVPARMTHPG